MLKQIRGVSILFLAVVLGCGSSSGPEGTGGTGGVGGDGGSGGTGGVGGDGGSGGTTMLEPGPTCTAFCEKVIVDCDAFDFDEPACLQECEESLLEESAKSEACGDAVEGVFQCVAELDCQGVYDWLLRTPTNAYPCRSAVEAVDLACPQI